MKHVPRRVTAESEHEPVRATKDPQLSHLPIVLAVKLRIEYVTLNLVRKILLNVAVIHLILNAHRTSAHQTSHVSSRHATDKNCRNIIVCTTYILLVKFGVTFTSKPLIIQYLIYLDMRNTLLRGIVGTAAVLHDLRF